MLWTPFHISIDTFHYHVSAMGSNQEPLGQGDGDEGVRLILHLLMSHYRICFSLYPPFFPLELATGEGAVMAHLLPTADVPHFSPGLAQVFKCNTNALLTNVTRRNLSTLLNIFLAASLADQRQTSQSLLCQSVRQRYMSLCTWCCSMVLFC